MTAEEILQAMMANYAALESYQDQGVVLTTWPDQPEPNEIIFTTYFRRPDRFRFEWTTHHPYPPLRHLKTNWVIWCAGKDAFRYIDRQGESKVEAQESLAMAIAGAAGVSLGSALRVPNMLAPEMIGAASMAGLRELELHEAVFEEVPCYCIRGHDFQGDRIEVYIGIGDLMLRAYVTHWRGTVSTEIRRLVKRNEPIEDQVFQFNPNRPGASGAPGGFLQP